MNRATDHTGTPQSGGAVEGDSLVGRGPLETKVVPIKSILFTGGLIVACLGALRWPLVGIVGYMGVYLVDPYSQWWGATLPFQRFSLLMAAFLAMGILLNWSSLARRAPRFGKLEGLLLAFLAVMWMSLGIGLPTGDIGWSLIDKMTKLFIFLFMFRRVVTSVHGLDTVFWCMALSGLYMGWEAFHASETRFVGGRLDEMGGGDFLGSNEIGVHLAAMTPIVGVLFIRFRKIWQRAPLVAAVPLMMNTIVQTRSRSAFLALAAGFMVAMFYSPRRYRLPLVGAAVVGLIGFLALADKGFWERMETIKDPEQETSANQRLVVWRASLPMFRDHPFGVGIGNFGYAVENYVKEGEDRDSHNTYITCYTELGVQGMLIFALIVLYEWRSLGRATRLARSVMADDVVLYSFALRVSLVIYLVGGITIKRLYAEGFWWFLVLPAVVLHVATLLEREADPLLLPPEALAEPARRRPLPRRHVERLSRG